MVRLLEKIGFLERDAENSYLALEPDDNWAAPGWFRWVGTPAAELH